MKESGDIILSRAKIYTELDEALAGSPQDESVRLADKVPSRANETTIFKSLGMAVEDIVAATLVCTDRLRRSHSPQSNRLTASVSRYSGKRSACSTTADGGTVRCDASLFWTP
jgi:ornithine cyclodeaminase/alanine dehydrogenase-like protein (mu-crystallin family)